MKQLKSTGDIRTLGSCAFCGGSTGTRDHCPSRVFLDEPYPNNLPVVNACSECNAGFSADEEYLACLVSCVIAGTTDPDQIDRKKIKRILLKKPALRSRIDLSISESDGQTTYQPESDRVSTVVTKLAKGHALFELHELCIEPPTTIEILPLMLLHGERLDMFENPGQAFVGVTV